MKTFEISEQAIESAKSELDAVEAAFAKKSPGNARVTVKTNVTAGKLTPHPQPLYGVIAFTGN